MDASRTCSVCFTEPPHRPVSVFSTPFPPGGNTVSPGNREQVQLPRLALRVFIFSCVCSNLRLINAVGPLLSGGGAAPLAGRPCVSSQCSLGQRAEVAPTRLRERLGFLKEQLGVTSIRPTSIGPGSTESRRGF